MPDLVIDLSGAKKKEPLVIDLGVGTPVSDTGQTFDIAKPSRTVFTPPPGIDWTKAIPVVEPRYGVLTTKAVEEAKANIATSAFTGLPIEQVDGNLEAVSEALYGEKLDPPRLGQRILNTFTATAQNRELAQLRAKQALGDASPETEAEVQRVKQTIPDPDEQVGQFPKALLDFLYTYGWAIPKVAWEGSKKWADKSTTEKIVTAAALPFMNAYGVFIQGGRIVKDLTEQSIGNNYGAMIDNGVDPTVARVTTGVLTGIDTALNAIPFGSAATAGARVSEKAITQSLLKGVLARIAVEGAKQTAMAAGQATAVVVGQEIAAIISNATTDTEAGRKDALQILEEIGIQTAAGATIGTAMAGAGVLSQAVEIRKNSRLDLAVQEAILKAQRIEAEGKAVVNEAPQAPKPTPGKQLLNDSLFLTSEMADALDADIRSSEGSADYVPKQLPEGTPKEIAKAAVDEYRLKMEARAKASRMIDDIRKINTMDMRPEHAAPIEALLKDFTVERFRADTIARLSDLRDRIMTDPDIMDYSDISTKDLKRLGEMDKTSFASLSVDDLEIIHDQLMQYVKVAKEAHIINVGMEKMELGLAVEKAIDEIGKPKPTKARPATSKPSMSRKVAETGASLRDFFGTDLDSFDLLAAKAGPTVEQVVFKSVHEGNVGKIKYTQDRINEFSETIAPIKEQHRNLGKWLDERVTYGEVKRDSGETVPLQLNRAEKMALYMHAKNPDNLRHLVEGGFGFKWQKGERNRYFKIDEATLSTILKSMSEEELLYCRASADLLKKTGQDLNQTKIDITDTQLPLMDDYYHIDTMPLARGSDAESEMAYQIGKQESTRIGLTKGMMQERVESKIPIYLNPITYDLAKSLDWASAYVNLEKPLRNASRLMMNKEFRLAITEKFGAQYWNDMNKALKDIAGQREAVGTVEAGALKLRNKMSTALLGINPWTVMKQPIAFLRYGTYVKSRYLAQGLADIAIHHGQVMKTHATNSPEWVNRTESGPSREVADVLRASAPGSQFGATKKMSAKLMGGIRWQDKETVSAGMQGAVLQALDEFKTGRISQEVKTATGLDAAQVKAMTPEEKMGAAYKFADWVTERTQSMSLPEFQSTIQRGSAFAKMLTLFGSEQSAQLNLRRRVMNEAKKGTPGAYKRVAKAMAVTLIAEPLAEMMVNRLRDAATGRKQEDLAKETVESLLNAAVGGYPIVRDVERAAARKIIHGLESRSNSIVPIQQTFDATIDAINAAGEMAKAKGTSAKKRAALKLADAMAEATSLYVGLPYMPMKANVNTLMRLKKLVEE